MVICSTTHSFECSMVALEGDLIYIGNHRFNIKDKWALERLNQEGTVDLTYLLTKLNSIKNKLKFSLINFIISEEVDGMYIEITYSPEGPVAGATIYINALFISSLEEKDILIFTCHELGHLLDSERLIETELFFQKWDQILKPLSVAGVGSFYFYYLRDFSNLLQFFLVSGAAVVCFGLIAFLKKFLQAYFQRRSEYRADILAVKLFGDLDAVINSLQLLSEIEEIPTQKKLFSSHPTLEQRIQALKVRFWYKILFKFIW